MYTWLLAEDDPSAVYLLYKALTDTALPVAFHTAPDGHEALAFLRREGRYTTAPRPDLVLLEINLPRKHGLEVLVEVKEDRELGQIPVVMLSISAWQSDVRRAYALGASNYLQKPWRFEDYRALVTGLFTTWCGHEESRSP